MYKVSNLEREESLALAVERKVYRENVENLKSASTYSHLNSANMDWNREGRWDKDNSFAMKMTNEDDQVVALIFFSHTLRASKHWALRHFVVLEEYRNCGVASHMFKFFFKFINEHHCNVKWLRFFSDKKSIGFYEKFGFEWLGLSKTGLPFTFVRIMNDDPLTSNKLFNESRDHLYSGIDTKIRKQLSGLKEVQHEFPSRAHNDLTRFFG